MRKNSHGKGVRISGSDHRAAGGGTKETPNVFLYQAGAGKMWQDGSGVEQGGEDVVGCDVLAIRIRR